MLLLYNAILVPYCHCLNAARCLLFSKQSIQNSLFLHSVVSSPLPNSLHPFFLSPVQVRGAVASPGGTTIYGIQAMEEKGARAAIIGAVQRATERAKELRPHPQDDTMQ